MTQFARRHCTYFALYSLFCMDIIFARAKTAEPDSTTKVPSLNSTHRKICNELASPDASLRRLFRLGPHLFFSLNEPNNRENVSTHYWIYDFAEGIVRQEPIHLVKIFPDALTDFVDFTAASHLHYDESKCTADQNVSPGCHLTANLRNRIVILGTKWIANGIFPRLLFTSVVMRNVGPNLWNRAENDHRLLGSIRFLPNQRVKSMTYNYRMGRLCFLVHELAQPFEIMTEDVTFPLEQNILCKVIDSTNGNFTSVDFVRYPLPRFIGSDIAIFDFNNHFYMATENMDVYDISLQQEQLFSNISGGILLPSPAPTTQQRKQRIAINERFQFGYLLNCYHNSTFVDGFQPHIDALQYRNGDSTEGWQQSKNGSWNLLLAFFIFILLILLFLIVWVTCNLCSEAEDNNKENVTSPQDSQRKNERGQAARYRGDDATDDDSE